VQQQDAHVYCDLFWARKVLGHLIRNADLYSFPGEPITISTEKKDGYIVFHVADVGPGIEKSEMDQIFTKFYRGKSQRHRVPGTGMGLAVAKAIVETHGGTIGVFSEVGRGSVFTFSLPMENIANVAP
jgi:two-component system sensor histidine kinase KdpD